jgi:hypothetical protein
MENKKLITILSVSRVRVAERSGIGECVVTVFQKWGEKNELIDLKRLNQHDLLGIFNLKNYLFIEVFRDDLGIINKRFNEVVNLYDNLYPIYNCKYNIDLFFEKKIREHMPVIYDEKMDNNSINVIFIFYGINYQEIKTLFHINRINISGGNNTKKHMLSYIQCKLNNFLNCYYTPSIASKLIAESFNVIGDTKNISRPIKDLTIKTSDEEIEKIFESYIEYKKKNNMP